MTTPQGGVVTYAYDWEWFITGPNPELGDRAQLHVLGTRTVNGCVGSCSWSFSYLNIGEALAGATVTLPSGFKVAYGYAPIGGFGDFMLAGAWSLTDRVVLAPDGQTVVEHEHRDYVLLHAARPNREWYTSELSKRWVSRDGYVTVNDPDADLTEYTYDANTASLRNYHRPIAVTERKGGAVRRSRILDHQHFTGDPYVLGLPQSEAVTVAGETATRLWTYNGDAFQTSETAYGITTAFVPDDLGNVATVRKANKKETSFSYSWGQVSETVTEAHTVARAINPDGTVAAETVAGRTTTFEYDELSRLRWTRPPGTTPVETTYDDTGGSWVRTTRGPSQVTTTVDGFGRPIRTENSQGIRTQTKYDAQGRVTYQSLPFTGASDGTTDVRDRRHQLTQLADEFHGLGDRLEHLPVAGDQRRSHLVGFNHEDREVGDTKITKSGTRRSRSRGHEDHEGRSGGGPRSGPSRPSRACDRAPRHDVPERAITSARQTRSPSATARTAS